MTIEKVALGDSKTQIKRSYETLAYFQSVFFYSAARAAGDCVAITPCHIFFICDMRNTRFEIRKISYLQLFYEVKNASAYVAMRRATLARMGMSPPITHH